MLRNSCRVLLARIIPAEQARSVVVVNQVALPLQLDHNETSSNIMSRSAAARNFLFVLTRLAQKSLRLAENKNLQIYVPEHFRSC